MMMGSRSESAEYEPLSPRVPSSDNRHKRPLVAACLALLGVGLMTAILVPLMQPGDSSQMATSRHINTKQSVCPETDYVCQARNILSRVPLIDG